MAEYIWLQQLQSYSQLLSAASQRMTSQAGPVSDWLLHQQGLFALGMIFAAESGKHYPDHSQCCIGLWYSASMWCCIGIHAYADLTHELIVHLTV